MAVSVTSWVGTGRVADGSNATGLGDASLATNNDFFIEGTESVGAGVKATTRIAASSGAALTGDPFDLSTTSENIYVWILILGAPNTLNNGGFGISVVDDLGTDSIGTWYVGPRPGFIGGWTCYVVHPSKDFHLVTAGSASWTTTGNPAQLTGIDGIGCRWDVTNSIMGNFDNCFLDSVALGTGYEITNGDGADPDATFQDFIDFEEQTVGGRYGGFFSEAGVLFSQCQLTIGDISGALDTVFTGSGFTVVWIDVQTSTESAIEADFYEMNFTQDTGSTTISLSNGNFEAISPQEVYLNFAGVTSATLNNVNATRARLIDLDGNVTWDVGTIKDSGTIDLGGSPTFKDIIIQDSTDTIALNVDSASEMTNVSNISFDGAGTGGSGSAAISLNLGAVGGATVPFDNITFANRVTGSADVLIPANVTGTITISITNGGDTPTVNDLRTPDDFVIANEVQVTISNVIEGSEVRMWDYTNANTDVEITGGTESIANTDTLTTGSITFNIDSNLNVLVKVFKEEYNIERFQLNSGSGTSRRVDQTIDRVYNNP